MVATLIYSVIFHVVYRAVLLNSYFDRSEKADEEANRIVGDDDDSDVMTPR